MTAAHRVLFLLQKHKTGLWTKELCAHAGISQGYLAKCIRQAKNLLPANQTIDLIMKDSISDQWLYQIVPDREG